MKSLMHTWRPNKIILSIAAGVMLFALNSSSFAAEQYTINSSEDYIDPSIAQDMVDSYVPFVNASQGFCSGGSCSAHGEAAVNAWANSTFFSETHIDDDGFAHDKTFVPSMSTGQSDFSSLSMDIFGIGRGLTQAWFDEYSETTSDDQCDGAADPITTPGRIIGQGGTDNCDVNFVSAPAYENSYEGQVELWTTGANAPFFMSSISDVRDTWIANDPGNTYGCNTTLTPLPADAASTTTAQWNCFFMGYQMYNTGGGLEAVVDPPMTWEVMQVSSPNLRQEWVDQLIIGYIATGDNFAQNFRSSLTFGNSWFTGADGENVDRANIESWTKTESEGGVSLNCATNVAECYTILDFRLEQGDTDMENKNDNARFSSDPTDLNTGANTGTNKIVSAFQMNMATVSAPNTSAGYNSTNASLAPDCVENQDATDDTYGTLPQADATSMGCVKKGQWAENIEQNMAGYFYSCINCSLDGAEHEYSAPEKALFQAWLVDMPEITSIIHAGAASLTSRLN